MKYCPIYQVNKNLLNPADEHPPAPQGERSSGLEMGCSTSRTQHTRQEHACALLASFRRLFRWVVRGRVCFCPSFPAAAPGENAARSPDTHNYRLRRVKCLRQMRLRTKCAFCIIRVEEPHPRPASHPVVSLGLGFGQN